MKEYGERKDENDDHVSIVLLINTRTTALYNPNLILARAFSVILFFYFSVSLSIAHLPFASFSFLAHLLLSLPPWNIFIVAWMKYRGRHAMIPSTFTIQKYPPEEAGMVPNAIARMVKRVEKARAEGVDRMSIAIQKEDARIPLTLYLF